MQKAVGVSDDGGLNEIFDDGNPLITKSLIIDGEYTQSQIDSFSPDMLSDGLIVKNLTLNCIQVYRGSRWYKLDMIPIPDILFYTDFGSGSSTVTTVNDSDNPFAIVDSDDAKNKKAMCASVDGVKEEYDADAASISHFYADVPIPSGVDKAIIYMTAKVEGEMSNDFAVVSVSDTSYTPSAGTSVSAQYRVSDGVSDINGYRSMSFDIPDSYIGVTARIIISFETDGAGWGSGIGYNPPLCVDELYVGTFS